MKKLFAIIMSVISLGIGAEFAMAEGEAGTDAKSQAILSHSYDAETKVLTLVFERGTYTYADVPAEVYESFKSSESLGTFYRDEIKGKYTSSKVEGTGTSAE
jgi:hypothetical protein